jgi:hypothetical protein
MASWTLPGPTLEEDLIKVGKDAVPRLMFKATRAEEITRAKARQMYLAAAAVNEWYRQSFILRANGPWLDQHARDRGTFRQAGESDAALAARLREVAKAVTKPALLALATAIVNADGIAGVAVGIELACDGAYYGDSATDAIQAYHGDGSVADGVTNGWRVTGTGCPLGFVIIVPAGTPAATAASVSDAVRQKKAGSFRHFIETGV